MRLYSRERKLILTYGHCRKRKVWIFLVLHEKALSQWGEEWEKSCLWLSSRISLASEVRMRVLPLHETKSHLLLEARALARVWVPSRDVDAAPPVCPDSPKRERSHHLWIFWDYWEDGSVLHMYSPATKNRIKAVIKAKVLKN